MGVSGLGLPPFGCGSLFSQFGTYHCSLEDVHFYSLSRSCILHLFSKANIGMRNTSYSCGYSPMCFVCLGSTNDAILEEMKKAYMIEQKSKEINQ